MNFIFNFQDYGRHNQYKETSPNRLTQLMIMSKIPSMVLPFYLVSRLSSVLDSNKSNLDAVVVVWLLAKEE